MNQTVLGSVIWNEKIFVRWSSTVRLAKKQLNWKREIGEESFFTLMKWWIAKFFLNICHSLWFQVGLQSGQHLQPLLHKRFPTGEVWVFHKFSQFSHTQRLTRRICTFSTKSINFSYLASLREAREATASSRRQEENSFHWPCHRQRCQVWYHKLIFSHFWG